MTPRTAYALLRVKDISDETRRIAGVASTPEPDRLGDIVDPLGITFKNPVPLLLYHRGDQPVGTVTFDPPTAEGLTFTAELPRVAEAGTVRDRVDEAWTSLKTGLLSAVSIGFRSMEESFDKTLGGFRFLKTEVLELSLVSIPANAGVSAHIVKMLTAHERGTTMNAVTVTDQIRSTEAARAQASARMAEIMTAAGETTLDAKTAAEYDDLQAKVDEWAAHLTRLRGLERAQLPAATRLEAPAVTAKAASDARGGISTRITVTPNREPGMGYVRAICAKVYHKGNTSDAAEWARNRWPDQPEIVDQIRAAVLPGTVTDSTWAGPLAPARPLENEFMDYLRPATLLGKIPGLKKVPFNTSLPKQTATGTYGWVGEYKPKPVTKLGFGTASLTYSKASGIIAITEELARLSSPSAESLVRADMVAGIAQFLDAQFIDPAVAAVTGVNPASITNGASTSASVGPNTDLLTIVQAFSTANMPLGNATIIMSETNALAIAFTRNTDGSPRFPGLTAQGGNFNGLRIVTSNAAGTNVIGLVPERILFAGDETGVEIDVSREATIQMDSAPDAPPTATTVYVSAFQMNLVLLRAEKFVNWARVDTAAVYYVTAANYKTGISPTEAAAAPPA